jgi:hypothetical protein
MTLGTRELGIGQLAEVTLGTGIITSAPVIKPKPPHLLKILKPRMVNQNAIIRRLGA